MRINRAKSLSYEQIQSLWIINPETGQIFWREKGSGRSIEKPCGCKDDNRISNLRYSSDQQNTFNKKATRGNKSGMKWVSLHKTRVERGKSKPWQAAVWAGTDRRQKYFATKRAAHLWACKQAKELHGEFYNSG